MGEVGEDQHELVQIEKRRAQRPLNGLQQRRNALPAGGGLQGIDGVAGLPEAVAQVGGAEAVLVPGLAEGLAHVDAPVAARDGEGRLPRRIDEGLGPGEAQHEHHLLLGSAA